MKQFNVYRHPSGEVGAVKLGWSWPGFFLTHFWALFKEMWWLGALGLAAQVMVLWCLLAAAPAQSIDGLAFLSGLAVSATYGGYGNIWRENRLIKRGFVLQGVHQAGGVRAAIEAAKPAASMAS